MSLPVRCFTCGNIIGHMEEKYIAQLESKITPEKALNTLGVTEYCCRRHFLGYVNILDQLLLFPDSVETNDMKNSDPDKE